MASLFELSNEFLAILSDLDEMEGEEPQESTLAQLAAAEGDIRNKVDGYASLIRHYQQSNVPIEAEIERLEKRRSSNIKRYDWLISRLKAAFEAIGETKVVTPLNTVSIVNNGGTKPLSIQVDPMQLPVQYRKKVETWQADKPAIRADLEAGKFIPGCILQERGNRLSIK